MHISLMQNIWDHMYIKMGNALVTTMIIAMQEHDYFCARVLYIANKSDGTDFYRPILHDETSDSIMSTCAMPMVQ